MLGLWRGTLLDAEADARAAVGVAQGRLPMADAYLIFALVERGEVEQAEEALVASGIGEDVPDQHMFTLLLASRGALRFAQGRLEEAEADLREANERRRRWSGSATVLAPRCDQALLPLVLFRLGRVSEARDEARAEVVAARAWGAARELGRALRIAGAVEARDGGIEMLRDAVDVLNESGADLDLAYALVHLGSALRRTKHRLESREPLRAGLELAQRCGAALLAERALEELRATGARPRQAVLSGVDSLTASERRVAEMAADGMSNPQIAQALFVTRRTVETQLSATYRKLDIPGRDSLRDALSR
jgi:DNA-binding CsgD family transcriptional regulator